MLSNCEALAAAEVAELVTKIAQQEKSVLEKALEEMATWKHEEKKFAAWSKLRQKYGFSVVVEPVREVRGAAAPTSAAKLGTFADVAYEATTTTRAKDSRPASSSSQAQDMQRSKSERNARPTEVI